MSFLNSLSLRLTASPLKLGPRRRQSSFAISFPTSQPLSFPFLTVQSKSSNPCFVPCAMTDDDEWKNEPSKSGGGGGDVAVVEPNEVVVVTEVGELKKNLKELLYGTHRGLIMSSETRAEIVEVISQLEAKNPTSAPTEALQLLNGKWILA